MEFQQVVRRRRMVREFAPDPVPRPVLERVLETGLHAPSAGFAQGLDLIVLDRPDQIDAFWRITDPWARKSAGRRGEPPVLVIPIGNVHTYLARYSEPDKEGLGMDVEEGWPVPYWDIDAAMSVMLILLAAVDEGLGGWFFGIFHGEVELMRHLGVPDGVRPIGAVALGYASERERRRGSDLWRDRKPLGEALHYGRW
jgi:nitroreductase